MAEAAHPVVCLPSDRPSSVALTEAGGEVTWYTGSMGWFYRIALG
jgi:cellobiose phosphorylase